MTLMEYTSWAGHEERNGCSQGKWDALRGKPSQTRADMPKSMPNNLNTSRFEDLISVRWEWYQLGYASVTKFEVKSFSKKQAEQQSKSLRNMGYEVIGIEKRLGKYVKTQFVIVAATAERGKLPYGAVKITK